jgi:nicotinamidase-related amidase
LLTGNGFGRLTGETDRTRQHQQATEGALVLIDYQPQMFEVIHSETSADLVDLNVRLLAKTAKAFDMPTVLSTVGVEYGINGPAVPSLLSELPGVEPIDRTSRTHSKIADSVRPYGTPGASG